MVDYFSLFMFLIIITTLVCTAIILLKYMELLENINLRKIKFNKDFVSKGKETTVIRPIVIRNDTERSQTIDVECEIIDETPKLSRYLLK